MTLLDLYNRDSAKSDAPYNGGREPWAKGSASNTYATLLREQWDDYMSRFAPHQETLANMAMSDADNLADERSALDMATIGYQNANSAYQRDLSRLGLSEASDERQNRERTSALSQRASEVDAVNRARMHAKDREMKIVAGGASVGLRDIQAGAQL